MDEFNAVSIRAGSGKGNDDSTFNLAILDGWSEWPKEKQSFFKSALHKRQIKKENKGMAVITSPLFKNGIWSGSRASGISSFTTTNGDQRQLFAIAPNAIGIFADTINASKDSKGKLKEFDDASFLLVLPVQKKELDGTVIKGMYTCDILANGTIHKESFFRQDNYGDVIERNDLEYKRAIIIFGEPEAGEDEEPFSINADSIAKSDIVIQFTNEQLRAACAKRQWQAPLGKREQFSSSQKKNFRLAVIASSIAGFFALTGIAPQWSSISFFEDMKPATSYLKIPKSAAKETSSKKQKTTAWSMIDYQTYVAQQFFQEYGSFDSSPKSVIQYMYYLSSHVPTMLMEYQLDSIAYKDASFYEISFKRNRASNSDSIFLDDAIKRMNTVIKTKFERAESDKGKKDSVVYRFYVAPVNSYSDNLDLIKKSKETELAIAENAERVKKSQSSLAAQKSAFDNLSVTELYTKPNELKAKFDDALADGNKKLATIRQLQKEFKELIIPGVPELSTIPNIDDMHAIKNIDDRFTWSEPALIATIPDKKALEENARKNKTTPNKKGKSASQKEINTFEKFGPAINVFEIKVDSNKSSDVDTGQKNTSMEQTDLLLLSLVADKPFVYIRSLAYNPMKGNWSASIIVPELIDKRVTLPFTRFKDKE